MDENSLPRREFRLLLDTVPERTISSFASLGGFVIRSASRTPFRLFLGSSAVEHSTVNRMVAGSNPARGANTKLNRPRRRGPTSGRIGSDYQPAPSMERGYWPNCATRLFKTSR